MITLVSTVSAVLRNATEEREMGMLTLIHPDTGDVVAFHKGEGKDAIHWYAEGYRALSERSNNMLAAAVLRNATEEKEND